MGQLAERLLVADTSPTKKAPSHREATPGGSKEQAAASQKRPLKKAAFFTNLRTLGNI
jgi:hypothetical protein